MVARLLLCLIYMLTAFNVKFVKTQCSGSALNVAVNEVTASFTFPTSGEYSANLNCAWLLTCSNGGQILYKIKNINIDCSDGYSLYDGSSTSASPVDQDVCTTHSTFSKTIALSSTQHLYLTFQSDATSTTGSDGGFQFLAISSSDQSSCSVSGSKVYLTATTSSQVLTSPNFPSNYPTSHNCEWIISPSDSSATVTVEFTFVDVEKSGSTCYDKLTVTSGDSLSPTEFCGDEEFLPNRNFDNGGSGGNITISLESDNLQAERGFVATYKQSEISTNSTSSTIEISTNSTSSTIGSGSQNQSDNKSTDVAGIVLGTLGGIAGLTGIGAVVTVLYKKDVFPFRKLKRIFKNNKVDYEKTYPKDVKSDKLEYKSEEKNDSREENHHDGDSTTIQNRNDHSGDVNNTVKEETVNSTDLNEKNHHDGDLTTLHISNEHSVDMKNTVNENTMHLVDSVETKEGIITSLQVRNE